MQNIVYCLLFIFSRYFEKLVYVMIDIDPQTASPPQLQATMKALPGVLEVRGGYRLSQSCWSVCWLGLVPVWFPRCNEWSTLLTRVRLVGHGGGGSAQGGGRSHFFLGFFQWPPLTAHPFGGGAPFFRPRAITSILALFTSLPYLTLGILGRVSGVGGLYTCSGMNGGRF